MYIPRKPQTTVNNIKLAALLLLIIGASASTTASAQADTSFRVAFYNVENLFDTDDDPATLDEDFTPTGPQTWTEERYQTKLRQIAQVMNALEQPGIMGVCEIENKRVLDALVQHPDLKAHRYGVVSFDSPDLRGIDVGLLYQTTRFELVAARTVAVPFPEWLEPEGYTTRDILHTTLRHKASNTMFHVFTNHWPSRRGGDEASEPRRLWVAAHLRNAIGVVLNEDPLAQILVMGDFNDEPLNRSISYGLGTLKVNEKRQVPGLLYNPFLNINTKEEGSYLYRDAWNMLDQIMYAGLQAPNPWRMRTFGIFRPDWLRYQGKGPSRTYGGPNYYGGYSDHFPVFMDIGLE